ncbi:MAG: hypothetical protein PHU63_02715, partial [Candidatus ainarchaeum sp.]|nr:hypothetical protein [Candidatus ainarchaeum sp.]
MFGSVFSYHPEVACGADIDSCCRINSSGYYSLNSSITSYTDLGSGDSCIYIINDDVVLDLNGFSISNVDNTNDKAIYLLAQNVTIFNGSINNSYYSIYIFEEGAQNISIYDVNITNITEEGITCEVQCINLNITNVLLSSNNTDSIGISLEGGNYNSISYGVFSTLCHGLNIYNEDNLSVSYIEIDECDYGLIIENIYESNFTNISINRCLFGLTLDGYFEEIKINDNNITNSFYSLNFNNIELENLIHETDFTNTLVDGKEILIYNDTSDLDISSVSPAVLIFHNITNSLISNINISN